jgi:hypothetical protein
MKRRQKIYTVSFVSGYGKMWEIDYTMEDSETVGDITEIRINGRAYKVTCTTREYRLIDLVSRHYADLYENAMMDDYEQREHHHMVD